MWLGHMLVPTYYVTGFRREGAGREFPEFFLRHWTLDDTLCLVSVTVYKIQTMDDKKASN